MKEISILSIVVLVVFGSFFGCKPKDDKEPKIYFSADVELSQDWVLQEKYTLPSAKASDNVDGDLTSSIKITNDLVFYELRSDSIAGQTVYICEDKIKNGTKGYVGKAGKYTIKYSATDEAGNTGSKNLTINVLNSLNDWSLNSNDEKISYIVDRKKIDNGSQDKIGGLYIDDHQYDEYGFSGIDGKIATTTFSPDKKVNYKLKIQKIGNIGSLALYVNFNRYSRVINFDDTQSGILQEYAYSGGTYVLTDFVYIISQKQNGINSYNPETNSFTITYQIERWIEDTAHGSLEVDGRFWTDDKTAIYQETYVPE